MYHGNFKDTVKIKIMHCWLLSYRNFYESQKETSIIIYDSSDDF